MKKEMWKLMMGIAMALFSFSMASCGDDDDEVGSADELIGTWSVIHEEGYSKANGEIEESWNDDYEEGKETLIFKEDHTVGGTYLSDKGLTWSYKGNKLTIKWENDHEDSMELTVLEMSSSRLVGELHDKYKEEGISYEDYGKITCKKMK